MGNRRNGAKFQENLFRSNEIILFFALHFSANGLYRLMNNKINQLLEMNYKNNQLLVNEIIQ